MSRALCQRYDWDCVPPCRSTGFKDELCEGGVWLYRATNNQQYLSQAKSYFEDEWAWGLSWDDKKIACQVGTHTNIFGLLESLSVEIAVIKTGSRLATLYLSTINILCIVGRTVKSISCKD